MVKKHELHRCPDDCLQVLLQAKGLEMFLLATDRQCSLGLQSKECSKLPWLMPEAL